MDVKHDYASFVDIVYDRVGVAVQRRIIVDSVVFIHKVDVEWSVVFAIAKLNTRVEIFDISCS